MKTISVSFLLCGFLFIIGAQAAQFWHDNKVPIENRLAALLGNMTILEKIGQLYQVSEAFQENLLREGRVGSYLNVKYVNNIKRLQDIAMNTRLGIPLIFGLDVIHGYRIHFPVPLGETASWDINMIEKSARIAATEAAAGGIHWTFAPMVDIARDPRWGRIMEGAGEDTYLGSQVAKARVRGFQGTIGNIDAVVACAKHFAGYGASEAGREYASVDMSDRMLLQYYMPPFQAAVEAGVGTFMSAFNDINGIPATGSEYIMRKKLKGEWGFKGFVVSDWESLTQLIEHGVAQNCSEAARKGMIAGLDMEMVSSCYLNNLEWLVSRGDINMEMLDDAVRRVLLKKFELGLFENPNKFNDPEREKKYENFQEHRNHAREIAKMSIVMLKNLNWVLPINNTKKIALIGPMADNERDMIGNWAVVHPSNAPIVTLYKALKEQVPENQLLYARGCDTNSSDTSQFAAALDIARQADVVILAVGENWNMSGEMCSRANIHLPGVQEELIKHIKMMSGKPVITVIMAGRPLIFNWAKDNVDGILNAWLLGSEAGNAITDVLFGKYNPSGKLPVTFPYAEGQIPVYYNMKPTGRPSISVYLDIPKTPSFEFGFGLSYTTFEYTSLELNATVLRTDQTLQGTFLVKNIGTRQGAEVAQVYIRDPVASVSRPVKELKRFFKIPLDPGQTAIAVFTLTKEDFMFYDSTMRYTTESGEINIMVGASSEDIRLKDTIYLQLVDEPAPPGGGAMTSFTAGSLLKFGLLLLPSIITMKSLSY